MADRIWITEDGQSFRRNQTSGTPGVSPGPGANPYDDPDTVTGLVLRLRASDEAYIDEGITLATDGETIRRWIDITANAKIFIQDTSSKRATLITAGFNGKPVLRFDGTDDSLFHTAGYPSDLTGSVYCVYSLSSVASPTQSVFSSASGVDNQKYMRFYGHRSGTRIGTEQRDGAATSDTIRSESGVIVPATDGSPNIAAWFSSGTAYSYGMNGSLSTTVTVDSGSNTGDWFGDTSSRNRTSVGASAGPTFGDFFAGDIAEILIYDNELSASDKDEVENYLGFEYGVTIA